MSEEVATVLDRPGPRREALSRGATFGRYVILDEAGRGGMGVVYSAYDATLHRRVALKLVHARGAKQHARLLAEARTMAQLSHAAIVTVHDVGELDGEVFLAMELVEGDTLRTWQAAPRPWREVVAMYVRIGEALAYAHERGVIHRDFKPENVLMDATGPRVTDFGLAKVDEEPSPAASLISKDTISGKQAGTPGYMSPEQAAGETTDARTDQFAFCTSLYEALHRALPPRGTKVQLPDAIAAAITRGYAVDRDERWPSMRELLAVLVPKPRRARWPLVVAALSIGAAVALSFRGSSGPSCDASARVASVWGAPQRDAIAHAFAPTGFAPDRAGANLDAWTRAWVDASDASCRATARGEQSAQLLDLRGACYARELAAAGSVIDLLSRTDRDLAARAGAITLPDLADCADSPALTGDAPVPVADAAAVAAIRSTIAEAYANRDVSRFEQASTLARDAADRAVKLGFKPLVGEAELAVGDIEEQRGVDFATAEEALWAAIAARPGETSRAAVRTWMHLATVSGEAHPDQGLRMLAVARGLADAGRYPDLAAEIDGRAGSLLASLRRFDDAIASLERGLASARAAGDDRTIIGMNLVESEATVEAARNADDEALAEYEKAVALGIELGPDFRVPTANALFNFGNELAKVGRDDEAIAQLRRSLDTLGDPRDSPRIATGAHDDLSEVLRRHGDFEGAVREAHLSIDVVTSTMPGDHLRMQYALYKLGSAEYELGRARDALDHVQQAFDLGHDVKPGAPEYETYISETALLHKLAQIHLALGQPAEALAAAERALATTSDELSSDAVVAGIDDVLARAAWAVGRKDHAREAMQAAQAAFARAHDDAGARAAEAWLANPH